MCPPTSDADQSSKNYSLQAFSSMHIFSRAVGSDQALQDTVAPGVIRTGDIDHLLCLTPLRFFIGRKPTGQDVTSSFCLCKLKRLFKRIGYILSVNTPGLDPGDIFCGRLLEPEINFDVPKYWISFCHSHDRNCNAALYRDLPSSLRVIDCKTR